jgi:hypothetical protein
MMGPLSYQLAREMVDDRVRTAQRRRTLIGQRPRTARTGLRPAR